MLAGGYTIDRILGAYRELAVKDVKAALEDAARVVAQRRQVGIR